MKTNTLFKGYPMRLAADHSNIEDFAYFVGGKIVDFQRKEIGLVVQMAGHSTCIPPGDYAVVLNNKVKKCYAEDFEDLFEPALDVDELPEDWKAYPEGFDFSVFGTVAVEMTSEESERLTTAIRQVFYASFLTQKSKMKALHSNPVFAKVTTVLKEHHGRDVSFRELLNIFCLGTPVGNKTEGMSGKFFVGSEDKIALMVGFKAPAVEVQKYLNRSALKKA